MDFISEVIAEYCERHSQEEPELLKELNRETQAKILMPRMLSGHLQGRFLSFISKMQRPQFILEIGTYTGYSALCLAEGLSKNGKLITIDINDELEEFSSSFIKRSPYADSIEMISGDAMEIIPKLEYTYDLVFIDAEKSQYPDYYDLVFDRVNHGGLIIADNVLWSGNVIADPEKMNDETRAIYDFNNKISRDQRVEVLMLPLRDGLSLIRKL